MPFCDITNNVERIKETESIDRNQGKSVWNLSGLWREETFLSLHWFSKVKALHYNRATIDPVANLYTEDPVGKVPWAVSCTADRWLVLCSYAPRACAALLSGKRTPSPSTVAGRSTTWSGWCLTADWTMLSTGAEFRRRGCQCGRGTKSARHLIPTKQPHDSSCFQQAHTHTLSLYEQKTSRLVFNNNNTHIH